MQENPRELLLTVKEAAQQINESPHVLRNWLRELKSHIQTVKGKNNYHYFDKAAIERLLLIQKLSRDQGYSIKQIDYYLATGENPLEPEDQPKNQDKILQELQDLKDNFKKQEQFNQALLQKLEEQSNYIKESLNKRDQQLMQTMKDMQQARIEASATQEVKKKSLWKRLFGN